MISILQNQRCWREEMWEGAGNPKVHPPQHAILAWHGTMYLLGYMYLSYTAYLCLNKLEGHTESRQALHLSHHLLILEVGRPFIFQPLQSGGDLLIKYLSCKNNIWINACDCVTTSSRLTTSISFSLLSFFSMVLWAEARLLSYILVPAASSIMDNIWNDIHMYIIYV